MNSSKTSYRLIREAYRLLNRKKFPEAVLILENVLASGVGDIYVLLLLAVGYLCTDQFGKLARFLTKMRELDPSYLPLIQMDAFLKLKAAAGAEEALRLYVELSAKYPGDAHIRRGRGLIAEAADFPAFQKNARLRDFMGVHSPPRKLKEARRKVYSGSLDARGIRIQGMGPVRRVTVIRIILIFCMAGLSAIGIRLLIVSGFPRIAIDRLVRSGGDHSDIDMVSVSGTEFDLVRSVKKEKVPVYYRSPREMTDDFNRSRTLIKERRYNEALLILNGLHRSNVNFVVKEKVEFLIKFIANQEERDFEEIPCGRVYEKKYRYRGFAVRWKGRIESIREKGGSLIIDLSVECPGEAPRGADVYSSAAVPGLVRGARVVIEGVIVDFPGKEQRPYVESRSLRAIK
ncbi:MAG: hypothetical protein E4G96_03780 [Chrysiogenales bacterium]|nr:MAG: hypothetical protein E4G96_03780 [Chrysiogenales bacterium]